MTGSGLELDDTLPSVERDLELVEDIPADHARKELDPLHLFPVSRFVTKDREVSHPDGMEGIVRHEEKPDVPELEGFDNPSDPYRAMTMPRDLVVGKVQSEDGIAIQENSPRCSGVDQEREDLVDLGRGADQAGLQVGGVVLPPLPPYPHRMRSTFSLVT